MSKSDMDTRNYPTVPGLWDSEDNKLAVGEGWAIESPSLEGINEYRIVDYWFSLTFDNERAAQDHVAKMATSGYDLHQRALAAVAALNVIKGE